MQRGDFSFISAQQFAPFGQRQAHEVMALENEQIENEVADAWRLAAKLLEQMEFRAIYMR